MKRILVLLLAVSACHNAAPRVNEVRDYLQAKARYDSLAKANWPRDSVLAALNDLGYRMRRLVGPLPTRWKQTFNPEWLPCCDMGGWVLDGMLLSDSASHTKMVVTVPGVLPAWLKQISADSSPSALAALSREEALTWIFNDDAHVYPFANLQSRSLPRSVFLAELVARTNGDPVMPGEVLVGVNDGDRIYIIVAPAAARIDLTAECGPAWKPAYQSCFARRAPDHPDYHRLVAQAESLAALAVSR